MSSTEPRITKGITHEQRFYLCLKKQECPTMKQAQLATWFKEKYSFPISQPTISHSLKKSTEILARGLSTPGMEATRVRKRPVRHPELEQAIYQWVKTQEQLLEQQQRRQQYKPVSQVPGKESGYDGGLHSDSGSGLAFETVEAITGSTLLRQAKRIAQEMDIDDTVFCPGWLSRFKARYGIKWSRKPRSSNVKGSDSITVSSPSSSSTASLVSSSTRAVGPLLAVPTDINSLDPSMPLELQPHVTLNLTHTPDESTQQPGIAPAPDQHPVHQSQQQQGQRHQREIHFMQYCKRSPYHSTPIALHSLAQHRPHPSLASSSLDFLQTIPAISPVSSSSDALISHHHHDTSLPSSPSSHNHIHLSESGEPFHLRAGVSANADSAPTAPGSGTDQSLQEAQRLVGQLRQYIGLHLQNPAMALQSLEALERELESTGTRGSITISEMDDG